MQVGLKENHVLLIVYLLRYHNRSDSLHVMVELDITDPLRYLGPWCQVVVDVEWSVQCKAPILLSN